MNLLLENFNPDWQQLRRQKLMLLDIVKDDDNELYGLIKLIDYIQDEAVRVGTWTEEEVFGNLNNN